MNIKMFMVLAVAALTAACDAQEPAPMPEPVEAPEPGSGSELHEDAPTQAN